MSSDDIIEEFEERARGAYKEMFPIKLSKSIFGNIQPKIIDIGEPKLKSYAKDMKITVKEHNFADKKVKADKTDNKKNSKKPPELW